MSDEMNRSKPEDVGTVKECNEDRNASGRTFRWSFVQSRAERLNNENRRKRRQAITYGAVVAASFVLLYVIAILARYLF